MGNAMCCGGAPDITPGTDKQATEKKQGAAAGGHDHGKGGCTGTGAHTHDKGEEQTKAGDKAK